MKTYQSVDAKSGEKLPGHFELFQLEDVNQLVDDAYTAYEQIKQIAAIQRAKFLRCIAVEIMALGDELLIRASQETALTISRLKSERSRTINQLNMFADLVEKGEWVDATLDVKNNSSQGSINIRKQLEPIGPIVVFGASNFPFAYSAAGGDTASALAAGCSVIVKAHPAHAGASQLVANAIQKSIAQCELPNKVYQHVHDIGHEIGQALVLNSKIAAVGFTGSFKGGKALFDLANQRHIPIPVFAEMGSVNPVLLLPQALSEKKDYWAEKYADSITLGMGQFCTNPGILLGIEGEDFVEFTGLLVAKIKDVQPDFMLHEGISKAFHEGLEMRKMMSRTTVYEGDNTNLKCATPSVTVVSGDSFLKHSSLSEELFGPTTVVVQCADKSELRKCIEVVQGQLTGTIIASGEDFKNFKQEYLLLKQGVGRIIFNGVSTGVEVVSAMHHGGPFPATTAARYSAVGPDAIKRFSRPVAYQNFPNEHLPIALKDTNQLNIYRKINGSITKADLN